MTLRADEVERARAILERAVSRHCPPWLMDHADDLVQTALLKLMDHKGDELAGLAASYHWRVAYSVIVDEMRRRRRRPEEDLTPHEGRLAASGADPEGLARGRQVRAAIAACLEQMLESRRLGVTLYLQGHSVPEVAGLLGWVRKKAENSVFRGMADLRACLTRKGIEP